MSRSIYSRNPNNEPNKSKPIKANESTKTTSITSPYSKTKSPSCNPQSTGTRSNSKKKKLSRRSSKTWSTSLQWKLITRLWKYPSLSLRMCECRIWSRSWSRLKHRHQRFTIKMRMSWENKLGISSMSVCFWKRRILKKMKRFSSFKESCIPIKGNFCFLMRKQRSIRWKSRFRVQRCRLSNWKILCVSTSFDWGKPKLIWKIMKGRKDKSWVKLKS